MKQAMQRAMEGGAKGVKLQLSGRLGGAEMARCEKGMEGSIPLSTLRCKVEYGFSEASTPQGTIGIKVWVNQGDYLTGDVLDVTDTNATPQQRRRGPRRGPGGGGGGR
jgi:small subunit ribosomal protein S3